MPQCHGGAFTSQLLLEEEEKMCATLADMVQCLRRRLNATSVLCKRQAKKADQLRLWVVLGGDAKMACCRCCDLGLVRLRSLTSALRTVCAASAATARLALAEVVEALSGTSHIDPRLRLLETSIVDRVSPRAERRQERLSY